MSYGNSSGEPTTFDVGRFYSQTGARLYAFRLWPELAAGQSGAVDLGRLAVMVEAGHLDVGIGRVGSWRDAPAIVDAFWRRQVPGKTVLRID